MGMCADRGYYTCEISRQIPDTDNFAVCARVPGQFNTADVRMGEQIIPLGQLCNANKDTRIKFALVSAQAQNRITFNECITTVNQLING